jgi:hypothetical protein
MQNVRAIFDNPEELTPAEVSSSDILKDLLKDLIVPSIRYSLKNNKVYARIFEINDSTYFIDIHKNHWVSALDTCLIWYIEDENFEMCTDIKNLINDINQKTKEKKVVRKKNNNDGQHV